jgi:hypothetical protein
MISVQASFLEKNTVHASSLKILIFGVAMYPLLQEGKTSTILTVAWMLLVTTLAKINIKLQLFSIDSKAYAFGAKQYATQIYAVVITIAHVALFFMELLLISNKKIQVLY